MALTADQTQNVITTMEAKWLLMIRFYQENMNILTKQTS